MLLLFVSVVTGDVAIVPFVCVIFVVIDITLFCLLLMLVLILYIVVAVAGFDAPK